MKSFLFILSVSLFWLFSGCTAPAPEEPETTDTPAAVDKTPAPAQPAMHPQAAAFVAALPPGLAEKQIRAIRKAASGDPSELAVYRLKEEQPPPAGITVRNLEYESGDTARAIRLYIPETGSKEPRPAILYLHGGGWVLGSIQRCSRFCGELAAKSGAIVAAPDYRLAPESPYPAALDDTLAAYNFLSTGADEFGMDADRIFLAGDSAGGQLAVTAALKEFETTEEKPAGLILFYPVVTLEPDARESRTLYGKGFNLDSDLMDAFGAAYVPEPAIRREPFVSPLGAELSVLPPVLLVTAEFDILRDQAAEFAQKLKKGGVPVRARRYKGAVHGFITFPGMDAFFQQGVADAASFLRDAGK
ncbi:MAG: alpha/beta hydrolase [Lentisphaeria bacterium]|nr:alpha/beta hydrolase [Lentisphaeria bacterium]